VKTTVEFRLFERKAKEFLPTSVGQLLGGSVRVVKVSPGDPIYQLIGSADTDLRHRTGRTVIGSWQIRRTYSRREFAAAELLRADIVTVFEPPGELTGTAYDEGPACPICGAGRVQTTPLTLDLRHVQPGRDIDTQRVPRSKDIAKTIADEVVVSSRLAAILREYTGGDLGPVIDWRRKQLSPDWFQLGVSAPPVEVVTPTQYGIDPFDLDEAGEYRCPLGHTAGLNLLTELTLARSSWTGADFVATRHLTGKRSPSGGVLVPAPDYLVSQRLYQRLVAEDIKGFRFEVAHLA
jgi:hypothetical protein